MYVLASHFVREPLAETEEIAVLALGVDSPARVALVPVSPPVRVVHHWVSVVGHPGNVEHLVAGQRDVTVVRQARVHPQPVQPTFGVGGDAGRHTLCIY